MSRYARAAKPLYVETPLWDGDNDPLLSTPTVSEHEAADTGLIWSTGEPIMRLRDDEW